MKFNVLSYLIGEGFKSIFKNKKSTFTSIGIMCATMFVFGVFFAIGENINSFVRQVELSQGMRVVVKDGATDAEIQAIKDKLNQIDGINSIDYMSSDDALVYMKEQFEEEGQGYLMDGYEIGNSFFRASFIVTLTDITKSAEVNDQILNIDNVLEIKSKDEMIDKLIKIANGIKIGTGALLVVLIIISIFIISNTIKLTVHVRRKEISIMKYVGATNGFIRCPFVVEGIIIGLVASVIAVALIGIIYNIFAAKLVETSFLQLISMNLVSFSDMFKSIVTVYLIMGIGIGVLGSTISMKKYLEV